MSFRLELFPLKARFSPRRALPGPASSAGPFLTTSPPQITLREAATGCRAPRGERWRKLRWTINADTGNWIRMQFFVRSFRQQAHRCWNVSCSWPPPNFQFFPQVRNRPLISSRIPLHEVYPPSSPVVNRHGPRKRMKKNFNWPAVIATVTWTCTSLIINLNTYN